MSTFKGLVSEFPDIRIDYFRRHDDRRPPLACFLSHVHSDHLAGLESLRSPFVYCSAATRAILLKLERYPCRINFAMGVLEARVQTFKSLKTILKPLPLETPTTIELEPGNDIQVTLFDANHCPGSVMFLIEGRGKAILYTGDVRSEPWFVNAVARNPSLVHYTGPGGNVLDTIYLDTSFTENINFQTKAQGIQLLLQKVKAYPSETIFHISSWTYGYEEVWIALSKELKSKIHVDEYKMRVYSALTRRSGDVETHLSREAPALTGFQCGNRRHEGCLTLDEQVRLHSCERGNLCQTIRESNSVVVWIQPAVAVFQEDGSVLREAGVGGGGDDLNQEPELDVLGQEDISALCEVFREMNGGPGDEALERRHQELLRYMQEMTATGRRISLNVHFPTGGQLGSLDLTKALDSLDRKCHERGDGKTAEMVAAAREAHQLPSTILFPYSRHSSLPELCHLVDVLKPRDVWPCTENARSWLKNGISIRRLFGYSCRGNSFAYDDLLESVAAELDQEEPAHSSQRSLAYETSEIESSIVIPSSPIKYRSSQSQSQMPPSPVAARGSQSTAVEASPLGLHLDGHDDLGVEQNSQFSTRLLSTDASSMRAGAFRQMTAYARGEATEPVVLLSTRDHHEKPDIELGDC